MKILFRYFLAGVCIIGILCGAVVGFYLGRFVGISIPILLLATFLVSSVSLRLTDSEEPFTPYPRLMKVFLTTIIVGMIVHGGWHFLFLVGSLIAPNYVDARYFNLFQIDMVAAYAGPPLAYLHIRLAGDTSEEGFRVY